MTRRRTAAWGRVIAMAMMGGCPTTQAADWNLCGHAAASAEQLYFDVAKAPTAHPQRSTTSESIVEDEADDALWIFVVHPVTVVVCRRGKAAPEAQCVGDEATCAGLVARLKADPRAKP